jgi:hypothetical protein
MSDTPRTLQEQCYGTCHAACERIDELERDLTAAHERIKRLEEAGDRAILNSYLPDRLAVWNAAKEVQP